VSSINALETKVSNDVIRQIAKEMDEILKATKLHLQSRSQLLNGRYELLPKSNNEIIKLQSDILPNLAKTKSDNIAIGLF